MTLTVLIEDQPGKQSPNYSWISMTRTSLGTLKFVLDIGILSLWWSIIVPVQEANGDNLGTHYENMPIQIS